MKRRIIMKNKTFLMKLFGGISLLSFLLIFALTLQVNVETVEASDNMVFWYPYTKYYTCGTPGTNSYGVVYTESGRDRKGYEDQNHPPYYWLNINIPGRRSGIRVRVHTEHPVTFFTYPATTEYVSLGRFHWRCR
ncbi:MAG: hypothetical protein OXI67_06595 [Candidatus Poribacteria bacterium]|nr:hypothetical protein [Candidatus Poribacteria bacterium]